MDNITNNNNTNLSYRVLNMNTYLNDIMPSEIEDFKKRERIYSGYRNIDEITHIYPGLYILGAISSLGKTTFACQMADQMAKNGENVIYFSMEQSALELCSKSISRITCEKNSNTALSSLEIRKTIEPDDTIKTAKEAYMGFANNITLIEGTFETTIDDIEKYVDEFVKKREVKPVVIIDYLQIIQAPKDSRMTTKDLIDSYIRRLKQIQTKHQIVMLVISSLNRQNYLSQIDYESFKESGGIEYTADVIWGLQLNAIHDEIFNKANNINEKRERIRQAKSANPRKIELVCLKNRFGISSYSCLFDYYPQYDLFKPSV